MQPISPPFCARCGCYGHVRFACVEETSVTGRRINVFCVQCGLYGHSRHDCNKSVRREICYKCGFFGHNPKDCRHEPEERWLKRCHRCAKFGHILSECKSTTTAYGADVQACLNFCRRCGFHGHLDKNCRGTSSYKQWVSVSSTPNPKSSSSSSSSSGSDDEDGELAKGRCCIDSGKPSSFPDDTKKCWDEDFVWLKL